MNTTDTTTEEARFRALAENATNAIILIDEDSVIHFANPATERIFGYSGDELIGQSLTMLMPERLRQKHRDALERHLRTGKRNIPWSGVELVGKTKSGEEIPIEISFGEYEENGHHYFSGTIADIRQRKAAAEAAERRLAFLAQASAELAASLDQEKTLRTIARIAVPEIADFSSVDIVMPDGSLRQLAVHHQDPKKIELLKSISEKYPRPPDSEVGIPAVVRKGESEFVPQFSEENLALVAVNEDHLNLLKQLEINSFISAPLTAHERVLGAFTVAYAESGRNYTESDKVLVEDLAHRAGVALHNSRIVRELETTRGQLEKQAEELEERTEELASAIQRLNLYLLQTPLAAIDCDSDARVIAWNPAAEGIFGYTADEAIGKPIGEVVGGGEQFNATIGALLHKDGGGEESTYKHETKDGKVIYCKWYSTPLVKKNGDVIGIGSMVQDVSDKKSTERQAQRKMEQLNALRAIDLAITASLDLRVTLTVILDQVVGQLAVDAAAVHTLNEFTQRLEYTAARGFRSTIIQNTELLLGECAAGQSALDRRTISVPNLSTSSEFTRRDLVEAEEFVSYWSTPLISKGKVTGVLEVFTRTAKRAGHEWISFLEALAGQAAIAVESASLFEDLERSNLELALAYDTSLEGWARALDLRDNVTEGHSRRVTEMTVRLARAMGVDDADLVHMRRGALLHDIGKVGIPDNILNKAGPLTEEEWAIMRKHPDYAFELLSPIEFLHPALDIPYAHHERWDGTGYPRQLKGEEIPLAARLFAVVDVWDALRSDRSYNKAWPEDKVREHIRGLAGTHLDPDIVEVFLGLDW